MLFIENAILHIRSVNIEDSSKITEFPLELEDF